MIWNERMECMDQEDLKDIQSARLRETVNYVYQHCPRYKKKLDAHGAGPDEIRGIDDITLLPFTTKEDLRDSYPFGLFSQPVREIAEIHVSSGTTGNPTVVGYAKEDVQLWSEVMARAFACAGAMPGGYDTDRLRVRTFYRRAGRALRRAGDGVDHNPGFLRPDQTPAEAYE